MIWTGGKLKLDLLFSAQVHLSNKVQFVDQCQRMVHFLALAPLEEVFFGMVQLIMNNHSTAEHCGYDNCNATVDQMCHNRRWTYLRLEEEVRGLSGLFGGILPGLPFPGGGTGFLGGTNGAAGLVGL